VVIKSRKGEEKGGTRIRHVGQSPGGARNLRTVLLCGRDVGRKQNNVGLRGVEREGDFEETRGEYLGQ